MMIQEVNISFSILTVSRRTATILLSVNNKWSEYFADKKYSFHLFTSLIIGFSKQEKRRIVNE